MRALFKTGSPEDEAFDEALLGRGGAAGLEHDGVDVADASLDA
jgi:hypothetical protein